MSTRWITQQLLSIRRHAEPSRLHPNNPCPPGVMRPGSATEAVLVYLQDRREGWYSRRQIMAATGRSDQAVNWALLFLRHLGKVECKNNDARNPRYLRYRMVRINR